MFVDESEIEVHAGRGGDGMVAFRREKYIPRGGPAGGDGGRGGDVILHATTGANTLLDYRHRYHIRAENGRPGGPKNMTGRGGKDLVLDVPLGTLVYNRDTDELLADMCYEGQRVVIAKGGDGGLGNQHFATSRNKAPRKATPGRPGESQRLRLELKLLADVGLVGFPSVGKSTLIAAMSNARPKIAAYPFTTLAPNLGVVPFGEYQEYVIADIPGLIEGAHEGLGLGIQFLKHVERTNVLVHVIEVAPDLHTEGLDTPNDARLIDPEAEFEAEYRALAAELGEDVDGADETPEDAAATGEATDEALADTPGMPEQTRDPIRDYETLCAELRHFNPELLDRPQIAVLNKIDLPFVQEREAELRAHFEGLGMEFFSISAAARHGLDTLRQRLGELVFAHRRAEETGADIAEVSGKEWWELDDVSLPRVEVVPAENTGEEE